MNSGQFDLCPFGSARVAIDGCHVGGLVPQERLRINSLLVVEPCRERSDFVEARRRFSVCPRDARQVARLCKKCAQRGGPDSIARLGAANVARVVQEARADDLIAAALDDVADGPAHGVQAKGERNADFRVGLLLRDPQLFFLEAPASHGDQIGTPLAGDDGELHAALYPYGHAFGRLVDGEEVGKGQT